MLRLWIVSVTVLVSFLSQEATARPYTAVVMESHTSKILHDVSAEELIHPAGLTKIMTLYVVFQALERGEIAMDDIIRISNNAAAEPPVKLGLRTGQRVRLRHLVHATGVGGSNDAATAIAEALDGSEAAFSQRMNRVADKLGMKRSHWKNANGLSETGHLTTAKDIAILVNAHYKNFPRYFDLFSRLKADVGTRELENTGIKLLIKLDNVVAAKTSYTQASGYSGVVMTEHQGRRLITVAFGRHSQRGLLDKIRELIGGSLLKGR